MTQPRKSKDTAAKKTITRKLPLPITEMAVSAELQQYLEYQHQLTQWTELRSLAATHNVDITAKPVDRAKQYIILAREAIQLIDKVERSNVLTFLVRTGWHEGGDLTMRTQYPNGPGRGFPQLEAGAAKDAVERAVQKDWISHLAAAAATKTDSLQDAAKELELNKPWPAGNLIEDSLLKFDLFGLLMARSYLTRTSVDIPVDIKDQSDFWEDHWHKVKDSAKKAKWLADAKRLNTLIGWT